MGSKVLWGSDANRTYAKEQRQRGRNNWDIWEELHAKGKIPIEVKSNPFNPIKEAARQHINLPIPKASVSTDFDQICRYIQYARDTYGIEIAFKDIVSYLRVGIAKPVANDDEMDESMLKKMMEKFDGQHSKATAQN